MRIQFLLFPFAVFLLFIVGGCSSNETTTKASSVAEIVNKPSKVGAYVVKKSGNTVLAVDSQPQDFSATGGVKEYYNAISFSNVKEKLEIGQRVRIEVDGPVMESYPAQANAGNIEILPTYKPDQANLTEAQVVKEAVKIAETKSDWFPAIRHVEYFEAEAIWKVGIMQNENKYDLEIQDKADNKKIR
ncbi:YobA family protein [Lederbergia panacisoli]|uniref:YobA family protein n=1 Tax=Lederbergia panacisoli TaxID=1255251 RepID=UPI00214C9756|nr:YobA family protein [Lederbergia panacisoli]MCR2821492.1 YobA family protein [Lederbergia panacisoli]